MNKIVLALLVLAFASCSDHSSVLNEKTDTLNQKSIVKEDSLKTMVREADSISQMESNEFLAEEISAIDLEISNQEEENAVFEWYEGNHSLTLQWIGWENPGSINFELVTEGEFEIHGNQENEEGDYLKIDGVVTLMGKEQLNFNGTIETKVSYVNNGDVCLKEGNYTFLATGKRKYWRLQEMDNCEGNSVVDYVDIYWKN